MTSTPRFSSSIVDSLLVDRECPELRSEFQTACSSSFDTGSKVLFKILLDYKSDSPKPA